MRVGVYGGSFDPPHVAHVLAVAYAISVGGFERVLVVPVYRHAFDKQLAPFEERVILCELAMGWLPGVEVSRVEQTLPQPSYTLHTLRQLKRLHPEYELSLIVGSDVLTDRPRWHAFDDVLAIAPPFLLGRAGHPHPDAPRPVLPEVSSTHVRRLLREAPRPETEAELAQLVPRAVLQRVRQRRLYA